MLGTRETKASPIEDRGFSILTEYFILSVLSEISVGVGHLKPWSILGLWNFKGCDVTQSGTTRPPLFCMTRLLSSIVVASSTDPKSRCTTPLVDPRLGALIGHTLSVSLSFSSSSFSLLDNNTWCLHRRRVLKPSLKSFLCKPKKGINWEKTGTINDETQ